MGLVSVLLWLKAQFDELLHTAAKILFENIFDLGPFLVEFFQVFDSMATLIQVQFAFEEACDLFLVVRSQVLRDCYLL